MSDTELAYKIRKALIDNGFVRYDHEQNKNLEWVMLEVLHKIKSWPW